ncbi:helix-turn-helix domain-containing protein [Tumebacillus lipolyticus]|uniref:Helix-turn-helix domain-containing protein n=1 Tax=Tumebacillus lipolyticus TaxID=1280370 RepID=A0ABW4ZV66_9BACL
MDNPLSLGQRIREIRMKKGVTQVDLAMGLCTPSMISQIESNRAKPSFKVLTGVAQRLEIPIERLLSDINLDLEYISQYKIAIGLVRAKEYKAAIPLLQDLLNCSHHQIRNSEIHLELASCHLELGDIAEAILHLNEVHEWANLRQDHELQATTLHRLGIAYHKKNEPTLALFHTKRALEELGKAPEVSPTLRAKVLTHLASIYEAIGKVAEATTFYEEALALNQESIEECGTAFLRMAETFHKAKSFVKAEEYATRASVILDELNSIGHRQDCKHRLILLKSKQGDWKKSVSDLLQLAETFEAAAKKEKAGAVYTDIALICEEYGEFEEAWAYAEKARLTLPDLHPSMGNVHQVLAKVHLNQSDAEKGEKHLRNAIMIFKQHGKLSELEEVTRYYCQHLMAKGEHNAAFDRMEKLQSFMRQTLEQRGIML